MSKTRVVLVWFIVELGNQYDNVAKPGASIKISLTSTSYHVQVLRGIIVNKW